MAAGVFAINLGGENEVPGVLNQQPPWVAAARPDLFPRGGDYLICSNLSIPLPDNSVDVVYTNNVPVDVVTWRGPGVQSSEIRRILKPGGVWIRDGVVYYTKP